MGASTTSETPLNHPSGIVMNHKESIFFVANCWNHTIYKILSSGMETCHPIYYLISLTHLQGAVSVFAGSGQKGSQDSIGILSLFNSPTWLAIDQKTGNLFVSDTGNHTIRKITPEGEFAFVLHHPQRLLIIMIRRGNNTGWIRKRLCRWAGSICEVQRTHGNMVRRHNSELDCV